MRLKMLVLSTAAAMVFLASGCNSQRPLPMIRELGDRAFSRGQYETARVEYKEYVDRKPGEARVQLMYARTLLALKQPAMAVEHASVAFDQLPDDDQAIETKAQALFESGRTDEMYKFLRGMADGRGQVGDFIRLGQYTAKLGDADGADHALKTAAKLDAGKTLAPQMALANFYTSIGDTAAAKRRLRMALYIDPANPEVAKRLRDMGEIPGPSLALPPE